MSVNENDWIWEGAYECAEIEEIDEDIILSWTLEDAWNYLQAASWRVKNL